VLLKNSGAPKNYSLGRNRSVSVKKQDTNLHVTIAEEGSDVKTGTFSSQRWARFMEVDEAINQLTAKQYVQQLNLHLGGKDNLSVTTIESLGFFISNSI
jgi:hypothetical protein